jgi:hypothetical protein
VWLLGVVGLSLGSASCVQTPDFAKNTSDVILTITKVTGLPGNDSLDEGDTLFSDVAGVIINDNAQLDFEVIMKNPTGPTGTFNDVMLTNYTIQYFRSDGRNIEGVDVPYAISGAMGTQIPAGGDGEAVIVAVRHQAKEEPPLNNISTGGSSIVLTTFARITVYGKTINGKNVSATTNLEITFADFADD